MAERFGLLRKVLSALGLSEERVEELIALIEGWLGGGDEATDEAQEKGAASAILTGARTIS
jgi:hypothetical protein